MLLLKLELFKIDLNYERDRRFHVKRAFDNRNVDKHLISNGNEDSSATDTKLLNTYCAFSCEKAQVLL